jgi:hypothetical protein
MSWGTGSFAGLILVSGAGLVSCKSAPHSGNGTEHQIDRALITHFMIRRPPGAGADPMMDEGGEGYEANPKPDVNYDCREPATLLEGISPGAVRDCFRKHSELIANAKDGSGVMREAEYRLERSDQPKLVLQEEETKGQPVSCLKKVLPVIPVPREIIYQAEPLEWSCFNSRVNIEANDLLGIKMPTKKWAVRLVFPLTEIPKDDAAMTRQLLAMALTPLLDPESPTQFKSKVVPNAICKRCFGKKRLYSKDGPYHDDPPPTWWVK